MPPTTTTPGSGPPVPDLVSLGQDCGATWCGTVGAGAPFPKMNEDILWPLDVGTGSSLDTSQLAGLNVDQWVADAHAGGNLAIVSIGGSDDQNWHTACNDTNRSAFAANLVSWTISHGFDGLSLDQEDNTLSSEAPPSTEWTECATAIANDAHAATTQAGNEPIVSEEVITNWQGAWIQPYASLIDQFDLMTYGDSCSSATSCPSFASDVADTVSQLCPNGGSCVAEQKRKMVLGLDMAEYPNAGTVASCGYAATYARNNGLRGAFDFLLAGDRDYGSNFPCQTAISSALN